MEVESDIRNDKNQQNQDIPPILSDTYHNSKSNILQYDHI